jgi:hypothetical protein
MSEEANSLIGLNSGPPQGVPAGQIVEARNDVAKAARELKSAADHLEQLALIQEEPFEEAVTLPLEEIRKRYTGTNGKNIEDRRLQVVKLLALHISTRDICDVLRMNHRTVAAIAAQEGQKIAAFSEQFAETLAGSAMADIALAETKKHDASHKDLMVSAGIKLTHAANFKMIGAAAGDETAAIHLEEENEKLTAARKFLEARKPKQAQPEITEV